MPIGAEFYQKQDTRIEGFTKNCNYRHRVSLIDSLWVWMRFLSLSSSDLGLCRHKYLRALKKIMRNLQTNHFFLS